MDAENNATYRANVLALVRALAARGARPFLLISSDPYTGSDDAAAWWRLVAQVADLVQEDYFSAKVLYRSGSVVVNRRMRAAFRRSVAEAVREDRDPGHQDRADARVPERARHRWAGGAPAEQGVVRGREVERALGVPDRGRDEARDRLVMGLGQLEGKLGRDPDKPAAACVYLRARSPSLCNGPAMAGKFDKSRTDGS